MCNEKQGAEKLTENVSKIMAYFNILKISSSEGKNMLRKLKEQGFTYAEIAKFQPVLVKSKKGLI